MSLLAREAPEVSDFSLLILCDLATNPATSRRHTRIGSLMAGQLNVNGGGVPGFITALETAGLVQVTRTITGPSTNRRQTAWSLTITEKGLLTHRTLMTSLRTATA